MVLSLVTIAVVGVFALIALALVSTDSTAGLIIGGILAFILCGIPHRHHPHQRSAPA
jgi:hypothetical protein